MKYSKACIATIDLSEKIMNESVDFGIPTSTFGLTSPAKSKHAREAKKIKIKGDLTSEEEEALIDFNLKMALLGHLNYLVAIAA
jgi:hypothetical protein